MTLPILQVLTYVGQRKTVANIYSELIALYPNDPFADKKAAGSIGGASKSGFIKLIDGYWVRMR